ncbi:MAG: hypothetical protein WBD00_06035, partial [Candidatus Omnitrophota bacterium]
MEERKNDLLLGRKDEEGVRSGGLRELQEEMGVAGTKGLLGNFDQDKVPNVILDVQTSISNMNDGTNTMFNTTLPKKLRTLIADAGRLLREEKADLGVTDKGDKSLEGRLNTMDKLEEVLRKGVQLGESQEKAERSKLRKNLPKATAEVFEVMRNMEEAGIQTDITVESLTELMDTFKDEDFILRFYGELMPKIAEQVRKLYEIVNEKGETEKLSRETIQGLINTIQGKIYGASKEYVHSMSMEEKKAWSNWTNQLSAAEGYDIETQVDAEISSLMDDITKEGGIELVAAIDNRLAELDSNIKKVQGQIKSREQELKKLKDKLAGPRDRDGNLLDDRGRPVQPNTIRQWREHIKALQEAIETMRGKKGLGSWEKEQQALLTKKEMVTAAIDAGEVKEEDRGVFVNELRVVFVRRKTQERIKELRRAINEREQEKGILKKDKNDNYTMESMRALYEEITDYEKFAAMVMVDLAWKHFKLYGEGLYEVQLLSGLLSADGYIANLKTGEGKTEFASVAQTIASLTGLKVFAETSNENLARKDYFERKGVLDFIGLRSELFSKSDLDLSDDRNRDMGELFNEGTEVDIVVFDTPGFNFELATEIAKKSRERIIKRGRKFLFVITDEIDAAMRESSTQYR